MQGDTEHTTWSHEGSSAPDLLVQVLSAVAPPVDDVGHVEIVRGIVQSINHHGTVEFLSPGGTISAESVLHLSSNSQVIIRLSNGSSLGVAGSGRLLIQENPEHAGLIITLLDGEVGIHVYLDGRMAIGELMLRTEVGEFILTSGQFLIESGTEGTFQLIVLPRADGTLTDLRLFQGADHWSIAEPYRLMRFSPNLPSPDIGELVSCDDIPEFLPIGAPLLGRECITAEVAPAATSETRGSLLTDVSPGGDIETTPGDGFVVTSAAEVFDLTPQPASLQEPATSDPPTTEVRPVASSTGQQTVLPDPSPSPISPPSERLILRLWDPARPWEAVGRADEFSGQMPEQPQASPRLISARSGEMVMLEARYIPRLQIENFLGLPHGSLENVIPNTSPTVGAALKALKPISLGVGGTIWFDVFFDAVGAVATNEDGATAFNDFAAMTVSRGGQAAILPIHSISSVGDNDASGWQTISYTASVAGKYSFGFTVLNDGPAIAFSRLFVDNIRTKEDSLFPLQGGEPVVDRLGGTYQLLSPAPIAVPDAYSIWENEVLIATGSLSPLSNDRDPDPFDVMRLVGIDRTGTVGRISPTGRDGFIYDPAGKFNYLAVGETATDRFSYIVDGGNGITARGEVVITIRGSNTPPIAVADAFTVDRATPVAFLNVLANDRDLDSDDDETTLRIVGAESSLGAEVTFSGAPGASLAYIPPRSLPAGTVDRVFYTIEDRHGARASSEAIVVFTLSGDGDVVYPDTVGVDQNTAVLVDVLANDLPGTRLIHVDTAASRGDVIPSSSRAVVYDPRGHFDELALGETASDSFTYDVMTPDGRIAQSTVTVVVTGLNDPPQAFPDSAEALEGGPPVYIPVLDNDFDVDTDDDSSTLRVVSAAAKSGAIVEFSGRPGEGLTYLPASAPPFFNLGEGQATLDVITYIVEDRHGARDTGTVTVKVIGRNDPVFASDDLMIAFEDTPTIIAAPGLLANDLDADGRDALRVIEVNGQVLGSGHEIILPSGAILLVTATGGVSYNPNGVFDYLAFGDHTHDRFFYRVSDGLTSDIGNVTVEIIGRNNPPVANADVVAIGEKAIAYVPVLANDSDVDRDDDSSTLRVICADALSGANVKFTSAPGAGLTYVAAGSFDFLGAGETFVDLITYTIADRHGAQATSTVTVTVEGENDPPSAGADRFNVDHRHVLELAPHLGLLSNDTDPDRTDRLTVVAVNGRSDLVGRRFELDSGAGLLVRPDGSVMFDPNGRFDNLDLFETREEHFTYTVADGHGAIDEAAVSIVISRDRTVPQAENDTVFTTADLSIRIAVLANDYNPDGGVQLSGVDTIGTIGIVRINPDGTVTYDPAGRFDDLQPGDQAIDLFRYSIVAPGGTSTAEVTVTIQAAENRSHGTAQLVQSFEQPFGAFVVGWGREPGLGASVSPVTIVSQAMANGTIFHPTHLGHMARLDAFGSTAVGPGTVQSKVEAYLELPGGSLPNDDGRHSGQTGDGTEPHAASAVRAQLVLSPEDSDANERLQIAFDWNFISAEAVKPNQPGRNDYAVFTVTDGTSSRVFVLSDSRETGFGASGWRTSVVDILKLFGGSLTRPLALTVGFAIVNDESSVAPSTLLLDNVRLTPSLGDNMELLTARDAGIFQTYRSRPFAENDILVQYSTDEETPVQIPVSSILDNDRPSAGVAAASLHVVAVDDARSIGRVTFSDGFVNYDPSDRFDHLAHKQTVVDSFTYVVRDGNGGIASAQASITIEGRNDPPTALPDTANLPANSGPTSIGVLLNDFDVDGDDGPDTLRVVLAFSTAGAAISFSGEPGAPIVYDPAGAFDSLSADEFVVDRVPYVIVDRFNESASSFVDVTIRGVNAPPIALNDFNVTDQKSVVSIDVLANDTDPNRNDRLSVSAVNGVSLDFSSHVWLPSGAVVSLTANGLLRYDPRDAFSFLPQDDEALDTFSYQVTDGHGGTDEALVSITIRGLNDAPVAGLDRFGTTERDSLFISGSDLLSNDVDPDQGDVLSVIGIDDRGTRGSVTFDGENIRYDPANAFVYLGAGEEAIDRFFYTVADSHGKMALGQVDVAVAGLNDPPVAVDDIAQTRSRDPIVINVLANDFDPDASDRLSVIGLDTSSTRGVASIQADGYILYDPRGSFDALPAGQTAVDSFIYRITDEYGATDAAKVTVTITGRNQVERLVESFEGSFSIFDMSSSFVRFVNSYQETDGNRGFYRPTDPGIGPASMAKLEARGDPANTLAAFLGISQTSLPRDDDGSAAAFGSALRVRTNVKLGDELSFDWMFDARDFVFSPPDGFADNDFAIAVIDDGSGARIFKLSDVREVGDQGASGWRTSIYTAQRSGDLSLSLAVVNDRSATPLEENSILLVDNIRINRQFDEGYQVVSTQVPGVFETLAVSGT